MSENESVLTHAAPQRKVSRWFGQYLINLRFQFKFSLVIFIFLSVAAFTIWVEGKLAVKNLIETNMITDPQSIENLHILNDIVGKTSILALAVTFGLSIFFSHFIAGPIYRFEKILEEIRAGNLNLYVRLRKHDEFKETAEIFNQAISSLRHKIQKERDSFGVTAENLKNVSEKLKQAGRTSEAAEIDHIILDIKNNPTQLKI